MEQSPNHKADGCSVEKQSIPSLWNTIIIIIIIISVVILRKKLRAG